MRLAKMYMMRVIAELELARNSEREFNQEALLLQGLHFAYKAHQVILEPATPVVLILHSGNSHVFCCVYLQLAGGLDSETMCAFEEIRQRVPGHVGGSRELLAAITSS